jgi:hypothetical protein
MPQLVNSALALVGVLGSLTWGVVNPLMRGVEDPVRSPMAARCVVPRFALTPLGSPPGASVKELKSDERDSEPAGFHS